MKKVIRVLVPVLLTLTILCSIVWYLCVYDRNFTRDSLLQQARFQDTHGNSRISAWFYNLAYDFSDRDEDVAIELADQYIEDGNYTKAEVTLTHAINTSATTDLYIALCQTFAEQDKLMDAVNLLSHIGNPEIKAEIEALRPAAPLPDNTPGYYNEYVNLQLAADGAVYYTTDGTYPTTAGPVYEGAIPLPAGVTQIYAVTVGENGLVSPVAVLEYTISGVIEEVTFSDSVMESAIRTLIGADEGDKVYTNQLWDITELTVPENVVVLDDLELLPYLKSLTIRNKLLDSLRPLASLSHLSKLDLAGSQFPSSDLEIIASLPILSELNLNECGLSTIASLSGAIRLTKLDLSNNTLRNLDVLKDMLNLQEVLLAHNAVVDLSALGLLENLQKLDISYNSVSSLMPLATCIRLKWLNADNNQLTELAGLTTMPMLEHLSANYNKLTDVSILGGCTELVELYIANNQISDISPLVALTKLEQFNFSTNQVTELPSWPDNCPMVSINGSYNQLKTIDSLKNMHAMTHINMEYNQLTNIDALADNYCLVIVNVFGNDIEDVEKLSANDIIVNYDPT